MPLTVKLRSHLLPATSSTQGTASARWRTKLKQNPMAYEIHKKSDAIRSSIYRMSLSGEHRRYNEGCKMRMRKYREALRAKKNTLPAPQPLVSKRSTTHSTRAATTELKAKRKIWREKARERRAKRSKNERDEINQKRREKRQKEREDLLVFRQQRRVEEKQKDADRRQFEAEQKRLQDAARRLDEETAQQTREKAVRSNVARRKSLSRGFKCLPKSPT